MDVSAHEELAIGARHSRSRTAAGLDASSACLGRIDRPHEDRHAVLLAESLREADMIDIAVGGCQSARDVAAAGPIAA